MYFYIAVIIDCVHYFYCNDLIFNEHRDILDINKSVHMLIVYPS